MGRPRTRSASHNAYVHETASVQQVGPRNQQATRGAGPSTQNQAKIIFRTEFNDLIRELKESRRQLVEQIQANTNLITQLTQQQHQNAGGSPAPYSSSDSSTSADEPPRRRCRKDEGAQAGAADRLIKDQAREETGRSNLQDPNQAGHQPARSRGTEPNLPSSTQTSDLTAMVRQLMRENQGLTNEDWGVSRSHTPFTDGILQAEYPQEVQYTDYPSL